MTARFCAFILWALAAASAVLWGLRLTVSAPAPPPGVIVVEAAAARGDVSRLLGVDPPAQIEAPSVVAASNRFVLSGVMAPRSIAGGQSYGIALIAVDGQPARPFKVGARIEGELTLQSVGRRSATLGAPSNPSPMVLELPLPPAPSTGVLPPPGFGIAGNAAATSTPAPTAAAPVAPIETVVLPIPPTAIEEAAPPGVVPAPRPLLGRRFPGALADR